MRLFRRWSAVALVALFAAASADAAAPRPVAKEGDLGKVYSAALKGPGACGQLASLVKEYLAKGLTLGSIAERTLSACGDLNALIVAILDAGVAPDVAVQAIVFAGGDPVQVAALLEEARKSFEARGRVLAYTPVAPAKGLDRSQQVIPAQFAPFLWGAPVRDAGPDRSRPAISPSSP